MKKFALTHQNSKKPEACFVIADFERIDREQE